MSYSWFPCFMQAVSPLLPFFVWALWALFAVCFFHSPYLFGMHIAHIQVVVTITFKVAVWAIKRHLSTSSAGMIVGVHSTVARNWCHIDSPMPHLSAIMSHSSESESASINLPCGCSSTASYSPLNISTHLPSSVNISSSHCRSADGSFNPLIYTPITHHPFLNRSWGRS